MCFTELINQYAVQRYDVCQYVWQFLSRRTHFHSNSSWASRPETNKKSLGSLQNSDQLLSAGKRVEYWTCFYLFYKITVSVLGVLDYWSGKTCNWKLTIIIRKLLYYYYSTYFHHDIHYFLTFYQTWWLA